MPLIQSEEYKKTYRAACCSQACCVWFLCWVAALMIPFGMSVASNNVFM